MVPPRSASVRPGARPHTLLSAHRQIRLTGGPRNQGAPPTDRPSRTCRPSTGTGDVRAACGLRTLTVHRETANAHTGSVAWPGTVRPRPLVSRLSVCASRKRPVTMAISEASPAGLCETMTSSPWSSSPVPRRGRATRQKRAVARASRLTPQFDDGIMGGKDRLTKTRPADDNDSHYQESTRTFGARAVDVDGRFICDHPQMSQDSGPSLPCRRRQPQSSASRFMATPMSPRSPGRRARTRDKTAKPSPGAWFSRLAAPFLTFGCRPLIVHFCRRLEGRSRAGGGMASLASSELRPTSNQQQGPPAAQSRPTHDRQALGVSPNALFVFSRTQKCGPARYLESVKRTPEMLVPVGGLCDTELDDTTSRGNRIPFAHQP